MGVFVFLPLVLPLTAWPIARLAEQQLHPRAATWLLAVVGGVLALCSTLCLMLLMVVGTAQLPGNPLPDAWADPEVRAVLPYDEVVGQVAIPLLVAVAGACAHLVWLHRRVRTRATRALAGLPEGRLAVLPDDARAYAYALPGGRGAAGARGRIVVSRAMLESLDAREQQALIAHEEAHLTARHHRFLLVAGLAARANPFLRPLRTAVAYTAERWADEDAARTVGDRRTVARAIGKAALVSRPAAGRGAATALVGFATAGPVPRRVAALLGPVPPAPALPPAWTAAGFALWTAAGGAAVSALASANATVTLFTVLKAATVL
ncbi:M56 family metallopeptidase [Streptomyces melanogenes]|uniref:M56 family metallopeptidase n=1 Tax=Streptomyces melanogenes TaxID=67326 RepID=A0ABZ1XQQ0_9ACTN|nr:M56 family metallopeptidase [Streptomyces melanogenes]